MKRRGFDDFGGLRGTPIPIFGGRIDNGVKLLMVLSVAVFIGATIAFNLRIDLIGWLAMTPTTILKGWVWQFLTASLMYTNPLSLVFGMLLLYSVGTSLEGTWGTRKFLTLYFALGAVTHALAFLAAFAFQKLGFGEGISTAETVVFGTLLGAFCSLLWNTTIMFFLFPMLGRTMFLGFLCLDILFILWHQTGAASTLCGLLVGHFFVRGLNFRWYRNLEANLKERLRVWRIKRKYKNFKVVDSEMKELWDDLEDRMNRDDKNKYIH
ncbi:MAG: rhomboid family intramembrane serine protease [Blastocatellia bacterium]|nr:rhomboid family intramembrane serine protease [Blastocatellia bacterium]